MKIENFNYSYYSKTISNTPRKLNKINPTFMAKGIFPGCFDPITNGHVDIIKRAAAILDYVTVLVSKNPLKPNSFLSVDTRIKMIEKIIKEQNLKNVKVASSTDYAVNYAKGDAADVIVRGLRDGKDFEYEMKMHKISNELNPNIDIIFFPTKPHLSMISSSEVRARYEKNEDISNLVPKCVIDFLSKIHR